MKKLEDTFQERDKFLTEVMGECWLEDCYHQNVRPYPRPTTCTQFKCIDCGKELRIDGTYITNKGEMLKCATLYPLTNRNTSLSTWQGFGKLWEWSQKQEWWSWLLYKRGDGCNIYTQYINPDKFANMLYEFLNQVGLTTSKGR